MKAGSEPDLVNSVYLQCETAVPFNNIRVHVFNPADGNSHFLPRTGADDEASAVLARALGRDSDLLVWVLVDRDQGPWCSLTGGRGAGRRSRTSVELE